METSNERHITDPMIMGRLVRTVEILRAMGRPYNVAIHDVQASHGLTKADVIALIKLTER